MTGRHEERPIDVYVDTNVLKFAVHHRKFYRGHPQTIKWGHLEDTLIVYQLIETDEVSMLKSQKQRDESRTLRLISDASRNGKIRLFMNSETQIESWQLPKMDSVEGVFFGADITRAPAPIKFGRVIAGANMPSMKDLQFNFLSSIRDSYVQSPYRYCFCVRADRSELPH